MKLGVRSFCYAEATDTSALAPVYQRAFAAQSRIGWGNFLKGYLATNWGDIMSAHYASSP